MSVTEEQQQGRGSGEEDGQGQATWNLESHCLFYSKGNRCLSWGSDLI